MTRPCKVGVQLPEVERFVPWPEYLDLARRAEAAAFDSIWVGDHLLYDLPTGRPGDRTRHGRRSRRSPPSPSGSRSGRSSRRRAFTRRRCWPSRPQPWTRSRSGRLILGLGAGWNRREYDAFGLLYDRRVSRFAEALAIIAPLLREGRTSFHGEFYDVDECVLDPRPVRPGGPPIMLGSNSPRMLSIGLPLVDSWNVWWSIYDNSVERFAEVKAEVDAGHAGGKVRRGDRRGPGHAAGR